MKLSVFSIMMLVVLFTSYRFTQDIVKVNAKSATVSVKIPALNTALADNNTPNHTVSTKTNFSVSNKRSINRYGDKEKNPNKNKKTSMIKVASAKKTKNPKVSGKVYGNTHVEGKIKDCFNMELLKNAYICFNSALDPNRFTIIPTNGDGTFNTDIIDDTIKSFTVTKIGYTDMEIDLSGKKSDPFEVCLNRSVDHPEIVWGQPATEGIVHFDYAKSSIGELEKDQLEKVISSLNETNAALPTIVELIGYTDMKGGDRFNIALSMKRAKSCREFLTNSGLKNNNVQFKIVGKGKDKINAATLTPSNLRRVEILVKKAIPNSASTH